MKTISFAHVASRLEAPPTKIVNRRQAELKLFCDRMPSIPKSTVAALMSHIPTEELHELYTRWDKEARNFTGLWKWHFMPKKPQP